MNGFAHDIEAPWVGREPEETDFPLCPYCFSDAETFYYRSGECLGCDQCIDAKYYDEI